MANNVTAIELARDGIRVVTGYYHQDRLYVTSAVKGEPLSVGSDGRISADEAVSSLTSLLNSNAGNAGSGEGPYIVSIPPDDVEFKSGNSQTGIVSSSISQIDYRNCVSIFTKENAVPGHTIVSIIPNLFRDSSGTPYLEFPSGVTSSSLYLEADAVIIPTEAYDYYKGILAKCKVFPYLCYISSLPPSALIEKRVGDFDDYAILNIENRYTYLSVIRKKKFAATKVFPYGIDTINDAAAATLKVDPSKVAEMRHLFGFVSEQDIYRPYPEVKNVKSVNKAFAEGLSPLTMEIRSYLDSLGLPEVPIIMYGSSVDEYGFSTVLGNQLDVETFDFTQSIYGAFDQSYVGCLGMIYLSSLSYQIPVQEAKSFQHGEEMKNVSLGRK